MSLARGEVEGGGEETVPRSEKLSVIGDFYINLSPECVTYAM